MWRLAVPFIALLVLTLGTVVIDRAGPPADFIMVNRNEVFTLDPQRMSWMQDFRLASALYEPLVRWNNDDFTIEPAAAAMPQISEDQRTYTFRIHDEARWSDGSPVTAHDYIWSWHRAILPDTAADYSMMFFAIEGAEELFRWRADQLAEMSRRVEAGQPVRSGHSLWVETQERLTRDVGLRAIGDKTLEVTLKRPVAYFLDLVAFGTFHPVYRPCVEGWELEDSEWSLVRDHGWHTIEPPPFDRRAWVRLHEDTGRLEQQHEWTKPERLITNGPYVLTDWRYRRGMRLALNPAYHAPEMVRSKTIEILSIEDSNTAVLAFTSGGIDWLSAVETEYQADLLRERLAYDTVHRAEYESRLAQGDDPDTALANLPAPGDGERRDLHAFATFGTEFFSFNCRPTLNSGEANPFHDARVRRAFVLSANRQAIVEQVTRLNEPIATALTPPGSIPGYDVPVGLGYDPERAREELARAGWSDRDGDGRIENDRGEPFPTVDLLFSTNAPRFRNISLALRDMWQRELGVRIELRGKDSKAFKEDLKSGQFMIGRGNWYGDYGDPTTFLNLFHSMDGNNDRGYSNPRIDEMLAEADRETDAMKRLAILRECERILFEEEVPMFTLCTLVQLYMYDPVHVRGLSRHPRLTQYLWELERVRPEHSAAR